MRERRFWRRAVPVMVPASVTAIAISLGIFLTLHVDWHSMAAPTAVPASAPVVSATAPPVTNVNPDNVDLSAYAARGVDRVTPEDAAFSPEAEAETYQMARLNGALRAMPQNAVPEILTAVNQWLRSADGVPCWVQSYSGSVSLVISPKAGSHPLLSAFSRCADAVERVTRQ
jgi:hypothetical protein